MDIFSSLLCSCSFYEPTNDIFVDTELHKLISTWLRTGFGRLSVPSDKLAQIRAFVNDASESLYRYDKTITEVERRLQSMRSARDDLRHRFDNAQSLITSPIRNLPLEILNEIFTWCSRWGTSDYSLSLQEDTVYCPTLRLSWICSSWRKFIQSTPDLWSSIEVTSSLVFHSRPSSFQLFLMYLLRSENRPLDFYYNIDLDNRLLSRKVENALDILLDHSTRWRHATLIIPKRGSNDWFSYSALRLNARAALNPEQSRLGNFPALEYLEIPRHLPWSDGLSAFFQTLAFCPSLKIYRGSFFSWLGHSIDTSHLTDLTLTFLFGESITELLRRLPALKSLSVEYVRLSHNLKDPVDEVPLHIDQSVIDTSSLLQLQIPHTQFSTNTWNSLRLPCLTHLQIDLSRQTIDAPFFSMLATSQCRLRTLQLRMSSSPLKQGLLDFIALHPTLENLSIDILYAEVLRDFTGHLLLDGRGDIAPNLRSLELGCKYRPDQIAQESLCPRICEMIESRCTILRSPVGTPIGISGLQTLTLVLNYRNSYLIVDHFIHTHLSSLEEAGLQVDLLQGYNTMI